jgi:hypothetical protein
MKIDVLILAQPSRERDSLKLILGTHPGLGRVLIADDMAPAASLISAQSPTLVILLQYPSAAHALRYARYFKALVSRCRCAVVSEASHFRQLAQSPDLDHVLLEGFQTKQVFSILDQMIAQSNPSQPNHLTALRRNQP